MRTVVGSMSAIRSAALYNGNSDLARQTSFAPINQLTPNNSKTKTKCKSNNHKKYKGVSSNNRIRTGTPTTNENLFLPEQPSRSFFPSKQNQQPNQWNFPTSQPSSVSNIKQFSKNSHQSIFTIKCANLCTGEEKVQKPPATKTTSSSEAISDLPGIPQEYQIPIEFLNNITRLLETEGMYHPNSQVLYNVNHELEDKVDAFLRDEAVRNLRFLHRGFFHLLPQTFSVAVNMIDRFAVKVKVKPKYLACVSMACYVLAADIFESNENKPTMEDLILVSKCGGTLEDFVRMKDIVKSKLKDDLRGTTCLDFLQAMCVSREPTSTQQTTLDILLCSLEMYYFNASCLALTLLTIGDPNLCVERRQQLALLCQISDSELAECKKFILGRRESFYGCPRSVNREDLVWTLSKRTLKNISSSSPPLLNTIEETD